MRERNLFTYYHESINCHRWNRRETVHKKDLFETDMLVVDREPLQGYRSSRGDSQTFRLIAWAHETIQYELD